MKVFKKILNTLVTILIVLVLVVSIFVAIFALTSKSTGISTIFGNTIQVIQSDSMKGGYQGTEGYTGGNFEKGDVIIGKATEFINDGNYEEGDIVTYKGVLAGNEDLGEQLICHRIVEKVDLGDGDYRYITKGDNNEVAEVPDQLNPQDGLMASSIGAVFHTKDYDGTVLKGVGNFMMFITSQMGFFLVVLLPMIIFFLYELIRVVLNIAGYKKAKQEDIKEEMRKEFEERYAAQNQAPQVQPVAANVGQQNNSPSMSADEFRQFQEFQEFKKMQQMYNQNSTQNNTAENAETKQE